MHLHPVAIRIIQALDEEGRVGLKPWGIPIELWRDQYQATKPAHTTNHQSQA